MPKLMEDYKKNIQIARLIARELSGNASSEELLQLKNWLREDPDNEAVYDSLRSRDKWNERKKILADYDKDEVGKTVRPGGSEPDKRQNIRRRLRYQCSVIYICWPLSLLQLLFRQNSPDSANCEKMIQVRLPGGNRAVLTLADGSTIVLDTAKRTIATQSDRDH